MVLITRPFLRSGRMAKFHCITIIEIIKYKSWSDYSLFLKQQYINKISNAYPDSIADISYSTSVIEVRVFEV